MPAILTYPVKGVAPLGRQSERRYNFFRKTDRILLQIQLPAGRLH